MARLVRKEKEAAAKVQKVYKLRDDTTGLFWRSYTGWSGAQRWNEIGTPYTQLSHLINSVQMTGNKNYWRGVHFEPDHEYSIVTYELVEMDVEKVEIR